MVLSAAWRDRNRFDLAARELDAAQTLGPDEYKVHVAAPPKKGQANREVVAALAGYFGLPVARVRIVRGEHSRIKRVALDPGG